MCKSLPDGKNYKIFADNFFTSMPLLVKLKEKSFHFVGTVRANRLKGCDLKTEKELKKDRRGSYDCKVMRFVHHIRHMMAPIPHRILWCYGEYQTLCGTLDGVDFQHGWPDLDKYIYLCIEISIQLVPNKHCQK
jgi:hypothetical protein